MQSLKNINFFNVKEIVTPFLMKPLADVFPQTEREKQGKRKMWDAGDKRPTPGGASWQQTENPDQGTAQAKAGNPWDRKGSNKMCDWRVVQT